MSCINVIVPWLKFRREDAFLLILLHSTVRHCWMMLPVDIYVLKKIGGPFQGPDSCISGVKSPNLPTLKYFWSSPNSHLLLKVTP